MSLFNRLTPKVKTYYYKSLKHFRRCWTLLKYIILGCIFQVIVFYLADLIIIVPENSEFLNIDILLTAVTFTVTHIITSKTPIVRFRINSNYRYGFNEVYGRLVSFIVLGVTAKVLPSINLDVIQIFIDVIPIFIKETIHHFNFLKHNLLWYKHVSEIETLLVVFGIIFTIIWLSANPIKYRKNKSENIFRETELLLKTKDEASIELLISELLPNMKAIVELATSEQEIRSNIPRKNDLVPAEFAQRLLALLFDDPIDDDWLFLNVVLKKRLEFWMSTLTTLINEYKKNPDRVYKQLQKLILINPIVVAFNIKKMRQSELALYCVAKTFSETLNGSFIVFEKASVSGFHNLFFKNTAVEDVSSKDYKKYITFLSKLITPTITQEDLNTLYSDINFLHEFFASLYKKSDRELSPYLGVIFNEDKLIDTLESLTKLLHAAEHNQVVERVINENISRIDKRFLPMIVINILAMLARARAWGISDLYFYIERFCKKLFDALFKDKRLKNYQLEEETKSAHLCSLSSSILGYFVNIYGVNHFAPPSEFCGFEKMIKTLEQRSCRLNLFFHIYPLADLQDILVKGDSELTGSEIIARLVYDQIALKVLASTKDELPKTIQELYLPLNIKHQVIDGKHYLIDNNSRADAKLELIYLCEK